MDITYIPMARGFVYLAVVLDWFSRRVLSWRVSITMEAAFCVEALEDALARHSKPEVFNTDQGSQFTGSAFTGVLANNGIAISMDGKGAWRDNVFVERLWRSVKYEEVYLRRDCDELSLTVEHRAAPSPRPLIVELAQQGLALALEVVERAKPVAAAAPSLDERITTVLAEAQEALPFADPRAKCRVRAATLHERIGLLATAGRIVKTADGYRLTER